MGEGGEGWKEVIEEKGEVGEEVEGVILGGVKEEE